MTQVIEQTWQGDASVKSDKLSSLPDNDSKLPEAFANIKLPNLDNADQDVAWLVPTNVYHNAKVYPAVPIDHADAPALMVLPPIYAMAICCVQSGSRAERMVAEQAMMPMLVPSSLAIGIHIASIPLLILMQVFNGLSASHKLRNSWKRRF